jgi:glucose-1-phosphate cytidylyltransferase
VKGDAVRHFNEKPASSESWVNGGYFVLNQSIFDYLDGDECVLEYGPLQRLSAEEQLGVYRHDGYWQCMDTLRDMELLNQRWAAGDAPWKIWSEMMDFPRLLSAA